MTKKKIDCPYIGTPQECDNCIQHLSCAYRTEQKIPTIDECISMFNKMGVKGWVAMDSDGVWMLFLNQPDEVYSSWYSNISGHPFTAQPVADWKKSKRRIE